MEGINTEIGMTLIITLKSCYAKIPIRNKRKENTKKCIQWLET